MVTIEEEGEVVPGGSYSISAIEDYHQYLEDLADDRPNPERCLYRTVNVGGQIEA